MVDQYTEGQLRRATASVGQELYDRARIGDTVNDVMSVETQLQAWYPGRRDHHPSIMKAERYALGAAITNLIMYHAVRFDGPDAEFIAYTPVLSDDPDYDPYYHYSDNLVKTLAVAETSLFQSPLARAAHWLMSRYDWVSDTDPARNDTRKPVGSLAMCSWSEGPTQAALFAQLFGIGRSKESGTTSESEVLKRAHEAVTSHMGHAAKNVVDFRSTMPFGVFRDSLGNNTEAVPEPGQRVIDASAANLVTTRRGSCRLDMGHELDPSPEWAQNHLGRFATLRCLLSFVKLEPRHVNSTLQNFLHASVNQAVRETTDEHGLLNPNLAVRSWLVREAQIRRINNASVRY